MAHILEINFIYKEFLITRKNDYVTATNICDTNFRVLFLYRPQPYLLK